MQIFFSFIFIVTVVNASNLVSPTLLLTTLQQPIQEQQESQEQTPARTQYHNQDSEGFYSYGYSGETSAKAEYKSIDGSSKGFYSYVDSEGKLQTVEYEAGGERGFQAIGTNLPSAPVDNRQAPAQVRDTPEVQMAKKAHFEALSEAELRDALTSNVQQTQGLEDLNNGALDSSRDQQQQEIMLEQNRQEQQQQFANTNRNAKLFSQQKQLATNLNNDVRGESESRLMTSYTLNNNAATPNLSQLLQSYRTLQAQVSSSDGLSAQAGTLSIPQTTNLENLQLTLQSYQTALQPTNYRISSNDHATLSDSAILATVSGHNPPATYLTH